MYQNYNIKFACGVTTFMTISNCYISKTQNPHSVRTTIKQFDNSLKQILVRMSPIKFLNLFKINQKSQFGVQHYSKTKSSGSKLILKYDFLILLMYK